MIVLILSDKEFLSIDPAPSNRDLFFLVPLKEKWVKEIATMLKNGNSVWLSSQFLSLSEHILWKPKTVSSWKYFALSQGTFCSEAGMLGIFLTKGRAAGRIRRKHHVYMYNFFYLLACKPTLNTISVSILYDTFQISLEKKKKDILLCVISILPYKREK